MAGKGVVFPIAADTSGFAKAVKAGVIEPTEDAIDALKDLGRAGGDVEQVEDGFKDAQRATKDYEDEIKDLSRTVDRETKSMGRDIGRNTEEGTDRAKRGLDEVKSESASTAKESAASFDGSAESIGDSFQEIAANAFSGFGPAGTAAGLAAAAGIGLVIKGFEDAGEAREASEEEIAAWADAFIEAGGRVLNASQIAASAQEVITDPEKWKAAKKNAELWGVSVETAVLAASGHAPSLDAVSDSLDRQRDAYKEMSSDLDTTSEQRDKELGRLADANKAYVTLADGIEQGRAASSVYSEALQNLVSTTKDATVQTDELGNKVYSLPGGKQILIDAKTGEATENLEGFKGDLDTVPSEKVATLRVIRDTSQWDNWQPPDKTAYIVGVPSRPGRVAW